jgi:FkbM family methyltransferase
MLLKTRFGGLRAVLAFDNWPMLVLGRIFDRKTGFVVYRKKGIEMLIDHHGGDEAGTRMCIASGMYRKYLPLLELSGQVNLLDLGANGGGFPLMLRLEGIDVELAVCVEMNPLTALRLAVNLNSNLGLSSAAINAAVCNLPEGSEIRIEASRGNTGWGIFTGQADGTVPGVVVRTTTFQTLYDRYFANGIVDICKIDIEAAEYEVIASIGDDVLRKIRFLFIEFHDRLRTPAVIERLETLGFTEMTLDEDRKTEGNTEVRVFRGPGA